MMMRKCMMRRRYLFASPTSIQLHSTSPTQRFLLVAGSTHSRQSNHLAGLQVLAAAMIATAWLVAPLEEVGLEPTHQSQEQRLLVDDL